ncbi:hypothetical protein SBRY_30584 [Actinacidiphila bryophytorum]|uniref:Uncharacterized protein n=1 Tax=Actinacidiphila bryophytorum TaxID=1436133 RepID=A0A9W4H1F5_9ACTN|nr:hypothetical protein SBRY_30584 [Actinacidiphila bryophytorum]
MRRTWHERGSGRGVRRAGRRRRNRRPVDGLRPGAGGARHPRGRGREGTRPGPAPDRPQQRRDPQRHLLPPRFAQGALRAGRLRRDPGLLREAPHPVRGHRQAHRGHRAGGAAAPARAGPAGARTRHPGQGVGAGPDRRVRTGGRRPRGDPRRHHRHLRLPRGRRRTGGPRGGRGLHDPLRPAGHRDRPRRGRHGRRDRPRGRREAPASHQGAGQLRGPAQRPRRAAGRGRPRAAHRAVQGRVLRAGAGPPRAGPRPGLPGSRPGLPLPRGASDPRRPRGCPPRPERGARTGQGGVRPLDRTPAGPGGHRRVPRHLADRPQALAAGGRRGAALAVEAGLHRERQAPAAGAAARGPAPGARGRTRPGRPARRDPGGRLPFRRLAPVRACAERALPGRDGRPADRPRGRPPGAGSAVTCGGATGAVP